MRMWFTLVCNVLSLVIIALYASACVYLRDYARSIERKDSMRSREECEKSLQEIENKVKDLSEQVDILKNINNYIEDEKVIHRFNLIKRHKEIKELVAGKERLQNRIELQYGLHKVGKGEDADWGFIILIESYIRVLQKDKEVLEEYLNTGEPYYFYKLPSDDYENGIYQL